MFGVRCNTINGGLLDLAYQKKPFSISVNKSRVRANNATISGNNNIIVGDGNTIKGDDCKIIGKRNQVSGKNNVVVEDFEGDIPSFSVKHLSGGSIKDILKQANAPTEKIDKFVADAISFSKRKSEEKEEPTKKQKM